MNDTNKNPYLNRYGIDETLKQMKKIGEMVYQQFPYSSSSAIEQVLMPLCSRNVKLDGYHIRMYYRKSHRTKDILLDQLHLCPAYQKEVFIPLYVSCKISLMFFRRKSLLLVNKFKHVNHHIWCRSYHKDTGEDCVLPENENATPVEYCGYRFYVPEWTV